MVGLLVAICLVGVDKPQVDLETLLRDQYSPAVQKIKDATTANRERRIADSAKSINETLSGRELTIRLTVSDVFPNGKDFGIGGEISGVSKRFDSFRVADSWQRTTLSRDLVERLNKGSVLVIRGEPRISAPTLRTDPQILKLTICPFPFDLFIIKPSFSIEP